MEFKEQMYLPKLSKNFSFFIVTLKHCYFRSPC